MTWNYRVMSVSYNDMTYYEIKEVYYTDGEPTSYCNASVDGWGSLADLKGTLDKMLAACDKDVLTKEDFQ